MQGFKRFVGALLGKGMIWAEMDFETGRTSGPRLIWLNRKIGTSVRTFSHGKWGELIISGPFRLFRGLPLYRYQEGNAKPFIVQNINQPELREVTLPPHALKTMVEERIFQNVYQDKLSLLIMMILGGVAITVIAMLAILAKLYGGS